MSTFKMENVCIQHVALRTGRNFTTNFNHFYDLYRVSPFLDGIKRNSRSRCSVALCRAIHTKSMRYEYIFQYKKMFFYLFVCNKYLVVF